MIILKWICFTLICLDTVGYILDKSDRKGISAVIGLCLGVAARAYVLYGTVTYWLMA